MGSNKVCSIGLDNHTVHFDRAQMDRVCSRWSTLIERAGHRSVRVCSKRPTLTELAGHRSIRACSRCPVLFQGGYFCSREQDNHTADTDWRSRALIGSRLVEVADFDRAGRAQIGLRLFEVALCVPGNKTWTLSPRFTPRCSTRRIEEKKSLSLLTSWYYQPYGGRVESR